jgi:hypothetical protein
VDVEETVAWGMNLRAAKVCAMIDLQRQAEDVSMPVLQAI